MSTTLHGLPQQNSDLLHIWIPTSEHTVANKAEQHLRHHQQHQPHENVWRRYAKRLQLVDNAPILLSTHTHTPSQFSTSGLAWRFPTRWVARCWGKERQPRTSALNATQNKHATSSGQSRGHYGLCVACLAISCSLKKAGATQQQSNLYACVY